MNEIILLIFHRFNSMVKWTNIFQDERRFLKNSQHFQTSPIFTDPFNWFTIILNYSFVPLSESELRLVYCWKRNILLFFIYSWIASHQTLINTQRRCYENGKVNFLLNPHLRKGSSVNLRVWRREPIVRITLAHIQCWDHSTSLGPFDHIIIWALFSRIQI